jgi:hypothetical protein
MHIDGVWLSPGKALPSDMFDSGVKVAAAWATDAVWFAQGANPRCHEADAIS